MSNDIQKILDQQRAQSQLHKKTPHEMAMAVNNYLKGAETHEKKSHSMSKRYQDPGFREFKRQRQLEVTQTTQWKESHAKGMSKREANGWLEKNQEAAKKKHKTICAGEYGIFESKKAAIAGMTAQGVVNAGGKLSVWLKTNPTEYYYITQPQPAQ